MKYLLGIDGGGSKTNLLCLDARGNTIAKASVGATYYRQDGINAVTERLRSGISQCLPEGAEAVACFGMPGFGDTNWRDVFYVLHRGGYEGDVNIEGYHDNVYNGDWELTAQMHGLNYLKWCRGGDFKPTPWEK